MVQSEISSIEHALTHHIRVFLFQHFSKEGLRRTCFATSLGVCLFAGSVMTFSLFTDPLIYDLQYSQLQINIIGGSIAAGLYFFLPMLGYLADLHGPVLLAALSMLTFGPSYFLAAIVYKYKLSYLLMCLAFMLIGAATASLYFCSLLTCAKIYPQSKGLSISGPVTAFGVSAMLITQITKLSYFSKEGSSMTDPFKCFIGFTILYCVLSLLNWIASVMVTVEKEVVFDTPEQNYGSTADSEPFSSPEEEANHRRTFDAFLKEPSTYMLLFAFLFLAGPMEMYVTNMGNLLKVVGTSGASSPISKQVSAFSLSSTTARLFVGGLSDFLENNSRLKGKYAIMGLLLVTCIPGLVGFSMIATNQPHFGTITTLVGCTYGAVFSLFPTIVASRWGVENLGSTWGTFMVAPATGSVLAGTFYALQYSRSCVGSADNTSWNYCLTLPFGIMAFGFALAIVLIFISWGQFTRQNDKYEALSQHEQS
ncbi:unnamed protein product [Kuraishia capsulata CBS 1993]|uniref:Probable transporter MCH1 n=1 Tax=Kuraishia capsulata CBS 1993 TaxID=1382522 RepID=W6MT88_9ASCO|nr:uncharacterized protein KUCA_T00004399001 [Kuraishia capsulata CBS 1993]CDK28417.1 unnamed protein product [Kuraishia capsulata CBS 1993]